MPRVTRVGPFGVAFTLYEVWRKLPPKQRARLLVIARREGMKVARRHGPRVAATIVKRARTGASR